MTDLTSCARGDAICPAHYRPDTAAQLQPIPYTCGTQHTLLPIAVGTIALMNVNNVRESATIFPRKLTFDLLTLKVVSASHLTWATCVPVLVFLGLSVFELFPMYATDRCQTTSSLNAPAYRAGHNKNMPLPICVTTLNFVILDQTLYA